MADASDVQRRTTAIALGVSIGLLFWGVIARVWFAGPRGNIGLAGIERCTPFCELTLWLDANAPTEITVLGFTALLFGLKSVVLATHAFAMVVKRERMRIRRRWLLVCTSITAAACAGFLIRMLGEPVSLSYPGFFAIIGGLGVFVLAYRIKP